MRWLREDCEVPADNIQLHLSPLDGFDDQLAVACLAATTEPIRHSLVQFPEQHPEAKWLILYWIGHGAYVDGHGDQALYLATADKNCLDHLETGMLRDFLQKHSWGQGNCLRRLVFIEACANQRRPVATAALNLKAHPRNLQPKIKLCEMRSASLGQFAHIGKEGGRRSGYFSNTLMDWLERGDHNRLISEIQDLNEHIKRELVAISEKAEIDQHPVFLQMGNWEGDVMIPELQQYAEHQPIDEKSPDEKLVEILLKFEAIADSQRRDFLTGKLRPEIRQNIPRANTDRLHVEQIVATVLRYQGGLRELIRLLKRFEPGVMAWQELERLLAELPDALKK